MSSIIKVRSLTKKFGEILAVDHLDFTVAEGEIYGFLGQNGAGKSTTIRMLLTLIEPTQGEIEIFGLPLKKHRKEILSRVGAIVEKPDLYKYLTAYENLNIFAAMSGQKIPKSGLMQQLEKVGLAHRAHSKVKTYSQGMKQRLGIAVALVHDPDLIILDEPVNGLDPQGIADIRNLVLHLSRDQGKTIFVSSHLLNEIELVADSMLIIQKGKKIAEGSKQELLNPSCTDVEIESTDILKAELALKHSAWAKFFQRAHNGRIILQVERNSIPQLVRDLAQMDFEVISVRPRHSLEDYFLSLTAGQIS